MENVQNYFVQVTVSKGRIIENEDGTTSKQVDEISMDSIFCKPEEISVEPVVTKIQEDIDQIINT